jgi:hypothetical protein
MMCVNNIFMRNVVFIDGKSCQKCDQTGMKYGSAACKYCLDCESEIDRQCNACGEIKNLQEFPIRADSVLGRAGTCRLCKKLGITAQVRMCDCPGCINLIPSGGNLRYCTDCKPKIVALYKINPLPVSAIERKQRYGTRGYYRKTAASLLNDLLRSPWMKNLGGL